jgi:hypothetical protein
MARREYRVLVEKPERDNLEELSVDRIILI